MDSKLLSIVQASDLKDHPDFQIGDTIEVKTVIREGDKKRIQAFKGIVIAMKGSGTSKTFTVRKISNGVGVEKILPLHSPNVKSIKILKRGKVRRSKLYYMRERVGKLAMKTGEGVVGNDELLETKEEAKPKVEEKKD